MKGEVVDGVRVALFLVEEELSIAVQWLQLMQIIFQNSISTSQRKECICVFKKNQQKVLEEKKLIFPSNKTHQTNKYKGRDFVPRT